MCSSRYILNRSNGKKKEVKNNTWPTAYSLVKEGVAGPGDTLELIEIGTEDLSYYGVTYIKQTIYTYGMERVNAKGDDYVGAKQRAMDWLTEKKTPTGVFLPKPRCYKCKNTYMEIGDVQSIRDCSRCWKCRIPKRISSDLKV